jgi:hypothetical protein
MPPNWRRCAPPDTVTKCPRSYAASLSPSALARRVDEMRFLDRRMAHLAGQLEAGGAPRTLINLRKEDEHAPAL